MCLRPSGSDWGLSELIGRELVSDVGHVDVFALVIVAAQLKHERAHMTLDWLAGDMSLDLWDRKVQSLFLFGLLEGAWVVNARTLCDHIHLQVVCVLEVVKQLFQGHVLVDLEPVPQGPLTTLEVLPGGGQRLWEGKQRQRQVDEAVLEALKLLGIQRWSALWAPDLFARVSVSPPEIKYNKQLKSANGLADFQKYT